MCTHVFKQSLHRLSSKLESGMEWKMEGGVPHCLMCCCPARPNIHGVIGTSPGGPFCFINPRINFSAVTHKQWYMP